MFSVLFNTYTIMMNNINVPILSYLIYIVCIVGCLSLDSQRRTLIIQQIFLMSSLLTLLNCLNSFAPLQLCQVSSQPIIKFYSYIPVGNDPI